MAGSGPHQVPGGQVVIADFLHEAHDVVLVALPSALLGKADRQVSQVAEATAEEGEEVATLVQITDELRAAILSPEKRLAKGRGMPAGSLP